MANLFVWFLIFLACTTAQHYNNTARLNLALLAAPSAWVTPVSSPKSTSAAILVCVLHRDAVTLLPGCSGLVASFPASMSTLYDQFVGRSMATNNTGVFFGRNLPVLTNTVSRWLQIDQEGGTEQEKPWMAKHRTGIPTTGAVWKVFSTQSTICPGMNVFYCGNWFITTHILAAFFQSREQKRNDNSAKLPSVVIGPMEFQDRFVSAFQALGSVSLAPFWPLSDDPKGLMVAFGFASTLYGSLAASFLLDQQGHTRAQGIQHPGAWMKSSMDQFAGQSQLIRVAQSDWFEPLFQRVGEASTGTWMFLVFRRAIENVETTGLYAWFLATALQYNGDNDNEAGNALRSVRSYPGIWDVYTDYYFYSMGLSKIGLWSGRHIVGGTTNAFGAWVLQMDVAENEEHNTYCTWLRSHSSVERNIARADSYFKIMDWSFTTCTGAQFCWDYVQPGLCVERTGAYETLANAFVVGSQFGSFALFERGQQGGAFEGEAVIGFEYCYSTLMDDNGVSNPADIATCIKNNLPVSGWVSDMTFIKNNEEKIVPSSDMHLLQIVDDQCDVWYIGWIHDPNVQNVLKINSHEPNSATNMTPAETFACGTQKPPNDHKECKGGEYMVLFTAECLACPPGRFSNKGKYNACQDCDAGKYSGTNASLCSFCEAGKSSQSRSSTCTTCAPGSYSDKSGSAECNECMKGRFSEKPGAIGCDACPLGKYQPTVSQKACVDCQANAYTQNFASTSPADCWCLANFYQNNDTVCVFCYDKYPQGAVRCDGAQNAAVYIQPGYMTWQSDQTFFFCEMCQTPECCPNDCDDASRCNIAPGASELVQCGSTASNAGCGKCVPDYSWNVAESKCIKCNDAAFSAGATVTFGIVLIILVIRVCPREIDYGMRSLVQMATVANACGPFFSWVEFSQIMIVLMDLDLPWPTDILDSIGSITDFFSMDLFEFECEFTDKTAFVGSYIMAVNIVPVLFVAFMVLISLPSVLSKILRNLHFPSPILTGNVTWTVINVFTVTIINFAASVPLRSVEQPTAENEPMSTMWRFPFVLLDSNTGKASRLAGVAIFCSWLFFMLIVSPSFLYYTHTYGSMLVRQCTVSMVIKYRNGFSFMFVIDAVYKITINMSGVFFSANPAWQIQSVGVPTMISLFILIRFFPHRFFLHGIVDCFRTFALVPMIFVCFAVIVQGAAWPFITFGVTVTIFCWAAGLFCLYQSLSSMMRGATSFDHFITTQAKLINSVSCTFLQSQQKKYNVYPSSALLKQISYFEHRGALEFRAVNHPQTTLNIKLKQSAVLWQLVASEMKNGASLNELEQKFQQQMTEQFSMNLWAQYREKHCSLMR